MTRKAFSDSVKSEINLIGRIQYVPIRVYFTALLHQCLTEASTFSWDRDGHPDRNFWISPSGKWLGPYPGHLQGACEILNRKFKDMATGYDAMFAKGYARVVVMSGTLAVSRSRGGADAKRAFTTAQLRELRNQAIERGVELYDDSIHRVIESLCMEDAVQDAAYRKEAASFVDKLKHFLSGIKATPVEDVPSIEPIFDKRYEGGIMFKARRVDQRYTDLSVVMLPSTSGDVSQQYKSTGAFGRSKDKTQSIIFIYNLLGPHDLTYCDTRVDTAAFIHEFIHYLDAKRSKATVNSVTKLRGGDEAGYFNDPGEFNAYFQELASTLDNVFRWGHDRFSQWDKFKELAQSIASKQWQQLMVPKYQKKFMKRLYGLFLHLTSQAIPLDQ